MAKICALWRSAGCPPPFNVIDAVTTSPWRKCLKGAEYLPRCLANAGFAVRKNEIFVMGQNLPLRSVYAAGNWARETVVIAPCQPFALPSTRSIAARTCFPGIRSEPEPCHESQPI
jgi:hypothetical protein